MTGKMGAKERALVATVLMEITQDWHCAVTVDADEVTIRAPFGVTHAHHSGATLLDALRRALETAKHYAAEFPMNEDEADQVSRVDPVKP